MGEESIIVGELWEFLGEGVFRVAEKNSNPYSPDSWIMRRRSDGVILYMHKSDRLQGKWRRWVNPVPTVWQLLLGESPL